MNVKKLVIIFVINIVSFWPAFAQQSQMLVLPFYITGNPEAAGLNPDTLADELMEATGFLVNQNRQIQAAGIASIRNQWQKSNYNKNKPFYDDNVKKVCLMAEPLYIMSSQAFFTRNSVEISTKTFSCRLNQFLGSSRTMSSLSELQKSLRRAVMESTPFINPARKIVQSNMAAQSASMDLAVILDTSGSMALDMPIIKRSLNYLKNALSSHSRLGMIFMKENASQSIIPFTDDWKEPLLLLEQTMPVGETTMADLFSALNVVERYNKWVNKKNLFIFSDLHFDHRRQTNLENTIRRISQKGVKVVVFPTSSHSSVDNSEWRRISRSAKIQYPDIFFGRKIYPLAQSPYFLVFAKGLFYTGRYGENLESALQSGMIDFQSLLPMPTTAFQKDELNLEIISQKYPQMLNQKVTALGPVISNLEKTIADSINTDINQQQAAYSVLLKNEGHSFWVPVQNSGVIKKMNSLANNTFYIGLHLKKSKGSTDISIFSHPVYIRAQNEVPQLFVTSWQHINKPALTTIDPNDIWFMRVQVIEIKNN